ncbi:MFS transporter [Paenibacillus lentus]|uniref:MFS transporter n=1 Tax=Paenibacillus lentus TaxID=1338368 RepID=UPI001FE579BB|nr:MFS transporter [Paenibacillus lentus]
MLMSFVTFFNMLSLLVILPMYMQMTLLIAAFTTGLILLPDSLLNCVLAPTIGRMFDKYGPKAVITPGTILVALGYGVYSQFGTDTALWLIVLTHIIMMLGIGIVLASVQTNTLNSLPKHTTRMASPYVNEIRKVSIDAASAAGYYRAISLLGYIYKKKKSLTPFSSSMMIISEFIVPGDVAMTPPFLQ